MTPATPLPPCMRSDAVNHLAAYRLARGTADAGWEHVTVLAGDQRTRQLASQLFRALGSVCANLVEAYSRSSGRDRARLLEYALGSARESREWYWHGRHVLGAEATQEAISRLAEVIRLLLVYVRDQRTRLPIRPR